MTYRTILISVEYGDILNLTLPYNMPFFSEVMVVTTSIDHETIDVAQRCGAQVHTTDAFYRRRAIFNKFAALEEGLDVFGRHGWMLIMDADIVIPQRRHEFAPQIGQIYIPRRRILARIPRKIPEERTWRTLKCPMLNEEFAGYFQLFHADDPVIGPAPWHKTDWTWAGGPDSFMHAKWDLRNKIRPPFDVLHLGEPFRNWAGRVTNRIDGTRHPDAIKRRGIHQSLLNARRETSRRGRFLDPFEKEKLKDD